MRGLLLIGIAVLWFWFVLIASKASVRKIQAPWIKWIFATGIFSVLLIAPLGDEVIGKYQFEALCQKYAVQYVDKEHAMNRRVFSVPRESNNFVDGVAIPIRVDRHEYRDVETARILVSYHSLHAEGGWLIRSLHISETNSPLLFERGCAPIDQDGFKKKFNIVVVN